MLIPGNKVPDIRPIGGNGSILIADSVARYGVNWRTLFNSDLGDDFTINSFVTPTGVYLMGTVVTNPTFTATYNTSVSGAYIISGTGQQSLSNPFTSHTFLGTVSGIADQQQIFTLYASGYNPAGSASSTTGFFWRQMEYWGSATGGGGYTQQFIKNLSNSGFFSPTGRNMTFNVNTSGHFAFYGYRLNAGSGKFKDLSNNIIGGFTVVNTGINFINSAGASEAYALYRSDFPQIGNNSLQVYY